jgi:hypothetical protein
VITGFNTDVEHNGVVYHVQTEDKGLDSPLILSLVYVGGTILASKRTHYHDLISSGFDENKLAERLQRQHKLICAAIHAGRIEDLKRQTERESKARAKASKQPAPESPPPLTPPPATPPPPPPAAQPVTPPEMEIIRGGSEMYEAFEAPSFPQTFNVKVEESVEEPVIEVTPIPETVTSARPPNEWERADYSKIIDYGSTEKRADGLGLSFIEEKKFVAGEFVKIQVRVSDGPGGRENVTGAKVTLKILGSSFRPLIFSGATEGDGTATFYAMLPHFKSGRAAILVSTTVKGNRAELRRVIHQAGA